MSNKKEGHQQPESQEISSGDDWLAAAVRAPARTPPPSPLPLGEQDTLYPTSLSAVKPKTPADGAEQERYQAEEEIARGGLGKITRAHDKRLGRPVALKELLRRENHLEERFLREALLTARLEHPGIVPIHDLGLTRDGTPYYAMKLIEGNSFDKAIAEKKTLTERLSLLPHVIDACEALAYAHSKRIIHRDLKPQNILIGSFGETIVVDWGLAKDLGARGQGIREENSEESTASSSLSPDNRPLTNPSDRPVLTQTGAIMGTPTYMPPEQAQGKPVDERADVYSLGTILYRLLAGAPPYAGQSSRAILESLLREPPEPLPQRQPGVPKDLVAIVQKAMARDAIHRYPSARQLADDLKKFQTGQIVGAYHYSKGELLRRFLRRHRAIVSILSLLVLTAVYSYWRVAQARDQAEKDREQAERALARAEEQEQETSKQRVLADQSADDLRLSQARDAIAYKDPADAFGLLAKLSPSFTRWGAARMIAEDALSKSRSRIVLRSQVSHVSRARFSPDGRSLAVGGTAGMVQLIDLETGQAQPFLGHLSNVLWLEFSPGGLIASASLDNSVRLWDRETGLLRTLDDSGDHNSAHGVYRVKFFPGGERLASAGQDGIIRVWDLKTGQRQLLEGHKGKVLSLYVFPDGERLASAGDDKTIRVWEIKTGQHQDLLGHEGRISWLAVSPDQEQLASLSDDGTVRLWEIKTGQSQSLEGIVTSSVSIELKGVELVFSPDGKNLAATSGDAIYLWDLSTRKGKLLRGHKDNVTCLAFSPEGDFLASASNDHTIRLWDLTLGTSQLLQGHSKSVFWVEFSPDGKTLASSSKDKTVRLWTVSHDNILLGHQTEVKSVAFSPQGLLASVSEDKIVRLWDLEQGGNRTLDSASSVGTCVTVLAHSSRLSFSPDGALLAVSEDSAVRLWSLTTGQSRVLDAHKGGCIELVSFSPDAKLLASDDKDSTISLWDVESGQRTALQGHTGALLALTFSPDGKLLASASDDKTARLWNLATGESQIFGPYTDIVASVAFSPDGELFAHAAYDGTVRVLNLKTQTSQLFETPRKEVNRVAFSPDGKYIVFGGVGFLHVIDRKSGQLRSFEGHNGIIFTLAFSPDGTRVAVATRGDPARLWDLDTGECRVLEGHEGWTSGLAFSADGLSIATVGLDRTVRLWKDALPQDPEALRARLQELSALPK